MDIGAHVSAAGGLIHALRRGEEIGADAVQIFTQSPRAWRGPTHDLDGLAAYRAAQAAHPAIHATFVHATYLINLATGVEELLERSLSCLADNLAAATRIGAAGVVLHVGSHRGAGLEVVTAQVATACRRALDATEDALGARSCPLLLENAAGAGGTVGRSFAELAALIDATGGDDRLGVCVDTQHLFASGVAFATGEAADAVIEDLAARVGLDRLGCLHLNDSKVPLGANRDRHENLGEGEIGLDALGWLISHPAIAHAPALLEVPGAGDGPRRVDIATARDILAAGIARRGAR